MGAGMVKNLLKAGFSVTGYNRTPARLVPLVELGMAKASSPADAVGDAAFAIVAVPPSALDSARPLFSAIGKHVVHVGESPGLGQSAKYALNLSQAITLQGMLEAWGLALRLGVPLAKMSECFEHSAARSGVGT